MTDAGMEPGTDSSFFAGGRVIILLILALVQFTSIVDFMVVMPLGPELMRSSGLARISSA